MAGSKGTNPTLLSGVSSLLRVGDPGSPCDLVFWSCSLRQVRTMAEGALEWARNAQGETYGQIERSVFFLGYCMKIINHRNRQKEKSMGFLIVLW